MRGLGSACGYLVLGLLASVGQVCADEPTAPAGASAPAATRPVSLDDCIRLAQASYPKIHQVESQLARKRARAFEARSAPYSDVRVRGGLAIAPSVSGNTIYSPNTDITISSSMALGWEIGVEAVLPLWTFGKLRALWDAADADVELSGHELAKARDQLALEVRSAFYGVQLARDASYLVEDALAKIDEHIARLEEEEVGGGEIDLIRMRLYREDLAVKASEARKQEAIALAALRFLTGGGPSLDVPDEALRPLSHQLGPLARYLTAARLHRPDLDMAEAGLRARQAQVRFARAQLYPDIAMSGWYRWRAAPEVTDIQNPFIGDPNFRGFGAVLVMQWKLDVLPAAARIAQAEADLAEMQAIERFALGGIAVEVEQAYWEADDARVELEASQRSSRLAKQWLIKVQQGIDVGTYEPKDIVEPAKEFALKRYAEAAAAYGLNMALAKLAQVTGWDEIARERGDEPPGSPGE